MSTLKHKGKGPQVLTAHGLKTGPVVYLTKDHTWSTSFQHALQTEDKDAIDAMAVIGDRDELANLIIGPYYIDIDPATGRPARYRERFRAGGPSYDPGVPTHDDLVAKNGPTIFKNESA